MAGVCTVNGRWFQQEMQKEFRAGIRQAAARLDAELGDLIRDELDIIQSNVNKDSPAFEAAEKIRSALAGTITVEVR